MCIDSVFYSNQKDRFIFFNWNGQANILEEKNRREVNQEQNL